LSSLPIDRLPGADQLQSQLRDLVGAVYVSGRRKDEGGSILVSQECLPRTGGIDDSAVVTR
jgi:hypothetical protein